MRQRMGGAGIRRIVAWCMTLVMVAIYMTESITPVYAQDDTSQPIAVSAVDLYVKNPIVGATAQTKIDVYDETYAYTGAVTWEGNPETFDCGMSYTATLTLKTKKGYAFAVSSLLSIRVFDYQTYQWDTGLAGWSIVNNTGDTLTLTRSYDALSHSYTNALSADGRTIVRTCKGCGETGSATLIVPQNQVYNGSAPEASLVKSGIMENIDLMILYREGDKVLQSPPVDAGTYTVSVVLGEATASGTYTIDPVERTIETPVVSEATDSYVMLQPVQAADGGTVMYACMQTQQTPAQEDWRTSNTFTNLTPGTTYYCYQSVTGARNYADCISKPLEVKTSARMITAIQLTVTEPTAGTALDDSDYSVGETAQYQAAEVQWREAAGGAVVTLDRFACDTMYTAAITLSAQPGYEFADQGNAEGWNWEKNTDGTLTLTRSYGSTRTHQMVASVSVDHTTITSTCQLCGEEDTVTLTAPTDTAYDGQAKEVTLEGTLESAAMQIMYQELPSLTILAAAPTDIGEYRALITWNDCQAYVDYTITRGIYGLSAPVAEQNGIATDAICLQEIQVPEGTVSYACSSTGEAPSIEDAAWQSSPYFGELDANTAYTFYVRLTDASNYENEISKGSIITTAKRKIQEVNPAFPDPAAGEAMQMSISDDDKYTGSLEWTRVPEVISLNALLGQNRTVENRYACDSIYFCRVTLTATAEYEFETEHLSTGAEWTVEEVTGSQVVLHRTYAKTAAHNLIYTAGSEADCTQEGYSGDLVCTVCGSVIESGSIIPALGHEYRFTIDEVDTTLFHGICERCEDTLDIQVTQPETLIYDGTAKTVGVPSGAQSLVTVDYYKDGNLLVSKPMDAGDYLADVRCGEASTRLEYTIEQAERSVAAALTVKQIKADSVILNKLTPKEEGSVFYAVSDSQSADDSELTWQSGDTANVFEDLAVDTDYYFWAKISGSNNYKDTISSPLHVKTKGLITEVELGIESPSSMAEPVRTVTNDRYTATITWYANEEKMEAGQTFACGTGYRVEVILTPSADWAFADNLTVLDLGSWSGNLTEAGEQILYGTYEPTPEHQVEVRNRVQPDCTHEGYSGDTYCSVCGEVIESGTVIPALGHQWQLTASGATATQRCEVCGTEKTATIQAEADTIYDGYAKEAVVTGELTEELVASIMYYPLIDGEVQLEAGVNYAPSDAGDYRAQAVLGDVSIYTDFSIRKAERTLDTPKIASWNNASLVLEEPDVDGDGNIEYACTLTEGVPGWNSAVWQEASTFEGIMANETYYFYIKVCNSRNYTDAVSPVLVVSQSQTGIGLIHIAIAEPQAGAQPQQQLEDTDQYTIRSYTMEGAGITSLQGTYQCNQPYYATVVLTPRAGYFFTNTVACDGWTMLLNEDGSLTCTRTYYTQSHSMSYITDDSHVTIYAQCSQCGEKEELLTIHQPENVLYDEQAKSVVLSGSVAEECRNYLVYFKKMTTGEYVQLDTLPVAEGIYRAVVAYQNTEIYVDYAITMPVFQVKLVDASNSHAAQVINVYYGQNVSLPLWTRNGYTIRWNSNGMAIKTDQTITANWVANTYKVTLNANGGKIVSGNLTSYTYGKTAALPTKVTRSKYIFAGWYTQKTGGAECTAISSGYTGDKTFYAHWTKVSVPKVKLSGVKNSKSRTAVLKWGKVTGAKQYVVYRSTKKTKGFKKIATVTKNTYTNKKLSKGKTYYYKVLAVKLDSTGKKISGKLSTVKAVKVKK